MWWPGTELNRTSTFQIHAYSCRDRYSEHGGGEMDNVTRIRRWGRFARGTPFLVLLAALRTGVVGETQPTSASPTLGTWVNVKTTEGLVGVTEAQQQFALKSQVPDAPSSKR